MNKHNYLDMEVMFINVFVFASGLFKNNIYMIFNNKIKMGPL